ncbi:hypothetical protein ABKN59_010315 [Abortiporus biennis]
MDTVSMWMSTSQGSSYSIARLHWMLGCVTRRSTPQQCIPGETYMKQNNSTRVVPLFGYSVSCPRCPSAKDFDNTQGSANETYVVEQADSHAVSRVVDILKVMGWVYLMGRTNRKVTIFPAPSLGIHEATNNDPPPESEYAVATMASVQKAYSRKNLKNTR